MVVVVTKECGAMAFLCVLFLCVNPSDAHALYGTFGTLSHHRAHRATQKDRIIKKMTPLFILCDAYKLQ